MSRNIETSVVVDGILKTLVFGSMLGAMVIAPNAVQLGEPILKILDKRGREREARRVIQYMATKKLVHRRKLQEGHFEIIVTDRGRRRARKVFFDELTIAQPSVWDHKWRLVLFDIPELHRNSRSALSKKLKQLGFYQLQKSAWLHPYPCAGEVEVIRQAFSIKPTELIVAQVDQIDSDRALRAHFKIDA